MVTIQQTLIQDHFSSNFYGGKTIESNIQKKIHFNCLLINEYNRLIHFYQYLIIIYCLYHPYLTIRILTNYVLS